MSTDTICGPSRPARWQRLGGPAILALTVGIALAGCGSGDDPSPEAPQTVAVEGADRLPSATAADWVSYADYVVVARPTAERFEKPTASELDNGEGSVLRDLTMTVDAVLWSSPTATVDAPSGTFSWNAFGYTFTDGRTDARIPMVPSSQPRLEVGHTYILALSWQQARCTEGDHVPAAWRGLGSGSLLPFDDGVIGQGEFEGNQVEPAGYAAAVAGDTLASSLAGDGKVALVSSLQTAEPEPREDYLPEPAPCP